MPTVDRFESESLGYRVPTMEERLAGHHVPREVPEVRILDELPARYMELPTDALRTDSSQALFKEFLHKTPVYRGAKVIRPTYVFREFFTRDSFALFEVGFALSDASRYWIDVAEYGRALDPEELYDTEKLRSYACKPLIEGVDYSVRVHNKTWVVLGHPEGLREEYHDNFGARVLRAPQNILVTVTFEGSEWSAQSE